MTVARSLAPAPTAPADPPALPGAAGPDDLRLWARCALPGERVAYHSGWLAVDRARHVDMSDDEAAAATRLWALADEATRLDRAGVLRLTQRRLGEGRWLYLAEKRANAG